MASRLLKLINKAPESGVVFGYPGQNSYKPKIVGRLFSHKAVEVDPADAERLIAVHPDKVVDVTDGEPESPKTDKIPAPSLTNSDETLIDETDQAENPNTPSSLSTVSDQNRQEDETGTQSEAGAQIAAKDEDPSLPPLAPVAETEEEAAKHKRSLAARKAAATRKANQEKKGK